MGRKSGRSPQHGKGRRRGRHWHKGRGRELMWENMPPLPDVESGADPTTGMPRPAPRAPKSHGRRRHGDSL